MNIDIKNNMMLQIIIGFLFADMIAGFFHWFEDSYLDYCIDIPFIRDIAKDNEMHHYFPRAIVGCTYLENISVTSVGVFIVFVILYITNKNMLYDYHYFFIVFFYFCVLANVIHKCSHMRTCEKNNVIIFLQKTGIFASSEHHKIHHELADQKYCPISEYNNYILDEINFWRILEYIIYLITGVKAVTKGKYSEYEEIHNYMHKDAKLDCPKTPSKKDLNELTEILKKYKSCDIEA